jgi:hypothetical protein
MHFTLKTLLASPLLRESVKHVKFSGMCLLRADQVKLGDSMSGAFRIIFYFTFL